MKKGKLGKVGPRRFTCKATVPATAEPKTLPNDRSIENPSGAKGGKNTGKDGDPLDGSGTNPDEFRRAIAMANVLTNAMRTKGESKVATASPSKRLNLRGLIMGRTEKPFIRRKPVEQGAPKVALVMDCSGSMSGSHSANARVLLMAFNMLAKQGVVASATAYATGNGGCCGKESLPCRPIKLQWNGWSASEGFKTFFSQKQVELTEYDIVLMFTDGMIGDEGADMQMLHRRGIHTVGAFVVPQVDRRAKAGARLRKYFDKVAVEADLRNLANRLGHVLSTCH